MKLRLRANTLRLRLLKAEVDALARGERVAEVLPLGGGTVFGYAIEGSDAASDLNVQLEGATLLVRVPAEWARNWPGTEEVGRFARQRTGDGELEVLVEKDWECLQRRDRVEDAGTFPHPR